MRYVFTQAIVAPNAEGKNVRFRAGDEIGETDLLRGSFESCRTNRVLVPVEDVAPPMMPVEDVADEGDEADDSAEQAEAGGDEAPAPSPKKARKAKP